MPGEQSQGRLQPHEAEGAAHKRLSYSDQISSWRRDRLNGEPSRHNALLHFASRPHTSTAVIERRKALEGEFLSRLSGPSTKNLLCGDELQDPVCEASTLSPSECELNEL